VETAEIGFGWFTRTRIQGKSSVHRGGKDIFRNWFEMGAFGEHRRKGKNSDDVI